MARAQTVTPALLARSVDYGEADKICTFLTLRLGKVSALARGARKSRRRFGGALSLFVIGEATLKAAARGDLLILDRFDCMEDLASPMARDVLKVAYGSYLIEAARELWPASQVEVDLFHLVCEALKVLVSTRPRSSLLRAYELQLLSALGLAPSMDRCVGCGDTELTDPVGFDAVAGGVTCGGCGPAGVPLDEAVRQMLSTFQRISLSRASTESPPAGDARRAREVMLSVMRHHLGKDLKSLEFLFKLTGSAKRPGPPARR